MQYYTDGISRLQLRDMALNFRRKLGLEYAIRFPVVEILELLHYWIPGFHYEVVKMQELQDMHAHAETDPEGCCILIREDVYNRACEGEGRDRMTVAHEMGHLVLHKPSGIRLYRRFDGQKVKPFRDLEWQANCFAGELLIPKHLVGGMSAAEVVGRCGVSYEAATYQLKKYEEEVIKKGSERQQKKAPRTYWQ